jgi:copper chaperone
MQGQLQEIVVSTPDMSCGHCVAAIESEVGAVSGVQSVKADLSTKQVRIAFDPNLVTIPAIESVLDDAGYPVAK